MESTKSAINLVKTNFLNSLFQKYPKTIFCLILCILTATAYLPVKDYPFINFDDGFYVYENSKVTSGLTIQNIFWAVSVSNLSTEDIKYYWQPLAWISHMVDVQLFGMNPQMHHLSNLFFHSLNTILLFIVFSLMTGELWKCFFMVVLFGLHPMNIESVAWIAERKNLLSGTFWMVTILAYLFYAKRPSIFRYLLVVLALSLGILAKPIMAVLPCVLLLLDYWPLKRINSAHGLNTDPDTDRHHIIVPAKITFSKTSAIKLVFEKIPLLLLSFAAIQISMIMLENQSQIVKTTILPLSLRIQNALVSYVIYLYKLIWPMDLAVFYPFPDTIPAWQTIGAVIFLVALTVFVLMQSKKSPHLIIGWLWFLGVFFPAIGLVQGGLWPAQADRWAYLPLIGIFIMIVWEVPNLLSSWNYRKKFMILSAASFTILLLFLTRFQLTHWSDTYTLFNRAIAVTENNFLAFNILGDELAIKGDYEKAEEFFLKVLKIKPNDVEAMKGLGQLAYHKEDYDKALHYYQNALRICPADTESLNMTGKTYYNLGLLSSKQRKLNEALHYYKMAISINPQDGNAYKSLADLLFSQGDMIQALKYYSEALRINPDDATTHFNIGVILYHQKRIRAADEHFNQALQIDNSYEKAKNALAMTRRLLEKSN